MDRCTIFSISTDIFKLMGETSTSYYNIFLLILCRIATAWPWVSCVKGDEKIQLFLHYLDTSRGRKAIPHLSPFHRRYAIKF